jgi:uncharacterized protein YceK
MTRALACGVVTLALVLTGCGTVGNLRAPCDSQVYGGVGIALDDFRTAREGQTVLPWLVWPLRVLDVPLSAIGDTVTLPVAVFAELNRRSNSEPPVSTEEKNYWREFWGVQESRELPVERKP